MVRICEGFLSEATKIKALGFEKMREKWWPRLDSEISRILDQKQWKSFVLFGSFEIIHTFKI